MSLLDEINKHWNAGRNKEIPTDREPIIINEGIKFIISTADKVQEREQLAKSNSRNDDLSK